MSSLHRDSSRLGYLDDHSHTSNMMEVPEHLTYKPPRVVNEYANVEPRYLNPRQTKEPKKVADMLPKQHIPKNPQFRAVESRLLNPRRESPARAPIPRHDPKTLQMHEQIAKKEWGAAQPRYLDPKKTFKEGEPTPRDQVEANREKNKRLTNWRDVCTTPVSMTFDEYRQRNRRLLHRRGETDHLEKKPKSNAHSPIRQYIKQDTPIHHHTMGPNYVSPSRTRGIEEKHWTPAGGAGGGKFSRKEGGGPRAASVQREAQYIRAWREHAQEKRVGRSNVPRVATLSPAQSFRRWESDAVSHMGGEGEDRASFTPQRYNSSNTVSPARGERGYGSGDYHSPQPHHHQMATSPHSARRSPVGQSTGGGPDEVVVGPVMVAVPAGTAVTLHSTNIS